MSFIKYSIAALLLCAYFSCKNSTDKSFNKFKEIQKELNGQNVIAYPNKDMFVVLVSNVECQHCNVLISTVLNDSLIMGHFSKENVCFIMPYVRDVERKIYTDNFSSDLPGKPLPPIIYNQRLYDSLENNLNNSVSGFFIIEPGGTIKLATGFSDNNMYDAIKGKL